MTTYKLYAGAKFEVSNGQPFNVFTIQVLSDTHVTYTDMLSGVPRTSTRPTFIKFLQQSKAKQV
jgi:hypothetical protein